MKDESLVISLEGLLIEFVEQLPEVIAEEIFDLSQEISYRNVVNPEQSLK